MNSYQAKQISLEDLLASQGFQPAKISSQEIWYCSPFRDESTPSFKVDIAKNVWFDHGEGAGGTVIDFVLRYKQISSVKEALSWLANGNHTINPKPFAKNQNKNIKLLELVPSSIKTPIHPNLLDYAEERGIPKSIVKEIFKEIRFKNHSKNRTYYALSIENRKGGFELRNKFFKGSISPKDYTFYGEGNHIVLVFEGMFDYASWLTLNNTDRPSADILILNSLSFHQQAAEFIHSQNYDEIHSFFDNDKKGISVNKRFTEIFGKCHKPQNHQYKDFDDLNAFLVNKKDTGKDPSLEYFP